MKTVWKYELPIEGEFDIEMPEGAQVLSVQEQVGGGIATPLVVWALVDTEADYMYARRRFKIIGTGNPADHILPLDRYIGTVQTNGGILVWHIWESP